MSKGSVNCSFKKKKLLMTSIFIYLFFIFFTVGLFNWWSVSDS